MRRTVVEDLLVVTGMVERPDLYEAVIFILDHPKALKSVYQLHRHINKFLRGKG